ncbi:hypothetical protein CROQUDRAFT_206446 [Cronartium quercuum f. sp. fusiforme G11]|uniref:RRM domain-containing protein n=1 Tax=Cronartium quercuum f. sp. fusiforme G11 TaxID=708437 RepID=A0A9P6NF84_9BASI|nr:hypothetical protein CROQUDRAFT_206446 [Cronartium quercuum f. sp. fusiforme G11]
MNNIRATKAINEKELALGIKASWHDDYKDSAYVYIGGLDPGLTEGDVITIFSQYGEPVDINMPKAKNEHPKAEAGNSDGKNPEGAKTNAGAVRSRGFCFLMYENQLSTNLAVDNLNGAVVLGRTLRVDHCKNYKQLERASDGKMAERDADLGERLNALPELHAIANADSNAESDASDAIDPEDPMAGYLLEQRRKRRKKEGKKKHRDTSEHASDKKRERKHKKRDDEDDAERKARKDAKRIKKLLKQVGPSTRADDRERERDTTRTRNLDEARSSHARIPPSSSNRDHRDRDHRRDDRLGSYPSYGPESDANDFSPPGNNDRYTRDSSSSRLKPSYRHEHHGPP